MSPTESFSDYWWFHVPNLLLAALIYTLIGRYVLELLFAKKQDAVMLTVFRNITDPVVNLVRVVTPRIVPDGLTIVFAMCWLLAARMAWFLVAVMFGMKMGAGA